MTIKPMTLRMGIPAMAKMGNTQNGCSIFATDSPMATDMVVPAMDA